MTKRKSLSQDHTLADRLAEHARVARVDAEKLPPGQARDALLDKVREIETASLFHDLLGAPTG